MSLEQILNDQKERELEQIEAHKYKLEEKYAQAPAAVEQIAALLGMPPEKAVRAAGMAAVRYQNLDWYAVLEIVRSFRLAANSIEEKIKN